MNRIIFSFLVFILAGCSSRIVKFEQYSVAMNLKVESDSSVYIGSDEKFNGVIWLAPILLHEKTAVKNVKLIQSYGIYYICADNFRNLWLIEPKSDGISANYESLDITPKDTTDVYKDVGFSRYGSQEKACVKFKYNQKEVFVDRKGKINEKCN